MKIPRRLVVCLTTVSLFALLLVAETFHVHSFAEAQVEETCHLCLLGKITKGPTHVDSGLTVQLTLDGIVSLPLHEIVPFDQVGNPVSRSPPSL